MSPVELDTSPSELRHPGWGSRCHKVSISEPTSDTYPAASKLSSDLSRLACTALSADELNEWLTIREGRRGHEQERLFRPPL